MSQVHFTTLPMTQLTEPGCSQGRVLSPLLPSVVVEGLLYQLQEKGYDVQGHANDLQNQETWVTQISLNHYCGVIPQKVTGLTISIIFPYAVKC